MPTDKLRAQAYRAAHTLVKYAKRDSDAVSVLADGTCLSDTKIAVFVVKGIHNIACLQAMCEQQGLLTPGKPIDGDGKAGAL